VEFGVDYPGQGAAGTIHSHANRIVYNCAFIYIFYFCVFNLVVPSFFQFEELEYGIFPGLDCRVAL